MSKSTENTVEMALFQIKDLAGYICDNDGQGVRSLSFALIIEEKAQYCLDELEKGVTE